MEKPPNPVMTLRLEEPGRRGGAVPTGDLRSSHAAARHQEARKIRPNATDRNIATFCQTRKLRGFRAVGLPTNRQFRRRLAGSIHVPLEPVCFSEALNSGLVSQVLAR